MALVPGVITGLATTIPDVGNAGVFELDGNVAQNTATPPPYDWTCVFGVTPNCVPPSTLMPAKTFQADFGNPDPTYFSSNGAGVKDVNDISAWGCVALNNPLNKDDILNAYGAAFVPTSGPKAGHLLVYLAQERDSNNGDSFAGFWLMKDQHTCDSSGAGTFSGLHSTGDLLVVSNYTNGGTSATVELWEWNPSSPQATNNMVLLGTGFTCGQTPPPGATTDPNDMCAIANDSNNTFTEPWAPHQLLDQNQFVEAGLDITNLLPPVLGNENSVCFSDFLAETRSSQQLTATLKDYTTGRFSFCVTPTVTTQQTAHGVTAAAMTIEPGMAVSDQATLSGVISGTPGGTIDYKLYSTADCSGTPVFDSGALQIINGVIPSSGTTQAATTVGVYQWRAFYSGDVASGGHNRAGASTCGDEPLTVVDASVAIAPSAVNQIGHQHVFTVTATAHVPSGTSVVFNSITPSVSPAPSTQTTTCGSPTVNGNTATCTVTINSTSVGTFTANATANFTLGGLAVTRTTSPDGSHAGTGGSGPAVKHYVNATIAIGPPNAVNLVGAPHTFTITVTAFPDDTGTPSFGPITTSVLDSANHGPTSQSTTCGSPTINGNTATCTLTINNNAPDTFTATATDTVTMGGLPVTVTTDGQNGNSGPATKTYGNGTISITPNGVNEVGHQHVFTVTVVGIAGATTTFNSIDVSVLDAANHAPGTMTSTCNNPTITPGNGTTTGDMATCTVTINNSTADVFTATATAHITVNGFTVVLTTDGTNGNSHPATKTYVDASVSIAPSAVNEVGHQHVFTVTVTALPTGQTYSFDSITPSVSPTPGTMSSTCGSPQVSGNVATCTVTINSSTAGVFTANVAADVTIDGLTVHRSTDGSDGPHGPGGSGAATKTYVDASISIAPSAVNEVGHPHTFTVTVTALPTGQTYSFDSITTSLVETAGLAMGPVTPTATTCGSPTVNGNVATCTVTVNSSTWATIVANATANVTIDGLQITRSTDPQSEAGSGPGGSGPATKNYVDASVGIGPSAVNPIGKAHTFDIVVTAYPAGTGTPSFDSIVTSVSPQPLSSSDTCATPTVNGNQATCTLTINNDLPDTFTANVTAQVTMGGVQVTRSTSGNAGPGGTGPATKTYVSANIGISPLEATDPVGDLHTLTVSVTTNNGSGEGQPEPAPDGTVVNLAIVSGPGTLASPSCTISGGHGTCTDVLTSDVEGTTVVQASVTLTVDGVSLTRTTGDSVPGDSANAIKHWAKVQPSITTTQSSNTSLGGSVNDTATVSGGLNPSGTVTFELFGPADDTCSGTPVFVSADQPLTNGKAASGSFTPTATGQYQWVATYNGDDANLTAVSGCGDEPVVITQVLGITTPNTGAGLLSALGEGLALVLTGTGIVLVARRRRRSGD